MCYSLDVGHSQHLTLTQLSVILLIAWFQCIRKGADPNTLYSGLIITWENVIVYYLLL